MEEKIDILKKKATWVRRQVFEKVVQCKKGHLGGTYSCTDLLVGLYYGGFLKFNSADPKWVDRDRFLIGKGHACLALYYIWADLGFFDVSKLEEYGINGGLGGQLDTSIPGAEHNTGSLGHALGIGAGMALAAKLDNKDYKTVALIGDAECDEGSIWESVMFSSRMGLNNLIGIIDRNRLSVTDVIEDDDGSGKIEDKFKACGWQCVVIDGHSFEEILVVFEQTKQQSLPLMIVANTVKGKGVSFMENGLKWHHSIPTDDEIKIARQELGG
jgi:transketolase